MNRAFIGIVLGVLLSGPVSAARMFEPMTQGPKVVAGVIDKDGNIIAGSGFTVRHHGLGQYEVRFRTGVMTGCGAMTITDSTQQFEPTVATVGQPNRGALFHVSLWLPGEHVREDHAFQFVATQAL